MTNLLRTRALRLPLVLLIAAAWFGISNHCALGALQHASAMQLPKCHASNPENPAPAKHNQKSEVECCKVLRATLLVASSSFVAGDTLSFAPYIYVLRFIPAADQSQLGRFCEWDTGPPGAASFAESVLQQSILAHAPPVSLS
ncbi:MAG: hypothetical protein DME29_06495 [Verrucomicrobia bacterium]|nr:MAG: hypothetical protein DME29_06495 [Verrucomicrobiota bacterium]